MMIYTPSVMVHQRVCRGRKRLDMVWRAYDRLILRLLGMHGDPPGVQLATGGCIRAVLPDC